MASGFGKGSQHGSSDVKEAEPVNPSCNKPLSVVSDMSSLTIRSSRSSRSSSKRSNATVKAAMAHLRLQQAEEAFRLEKEQMEAKEREEALERAEQMEAKEREEALERAEQQRREEGQRRREEEQRKEERRRKVNAMARKRDLELLRLPQEQQAAEYEEQLWKIRLVVKPLHFLILL